jgi:hypothetical protein
LPEPQRINHVVMMEEIAHGERVREYVVEGQVPGNTWRELCRGISIGIVQGTAPIDRRNRNRHHEHGRGRIDGCKSFPENDFLSGRPPVARK